MKKKLDGTWVAIRNDIPRGSRSVLSYTPSKFPLASGDELASILETESKFAEIRALNEAYTKSRRLMICGKKNATRIDAFGLTSSIVQDEAPDFDDDDD
jgi:hypothetical protein